MKRHFLLLLLLCFCHWGFPAAVSPDKARTVALNFIKTCERNEPALKNTMFSLADAVQIKVNNGLQTALYLFRAEPEGFVIIAGDDKVYPVLAYSFSHSLGMENMAPALRAWLNNYVNQISVAVASPSQPTLTSEWQYYLGGSFNTAPKYNQVAPLMLTTWDQNNFYNAQCPADENGPGGHVYAGCVATAYGQIMKYYNYPPQGSGSNSYYDWDYGNISANFGNTQYQWTQMPNSLNTHNNAIAQLLFHCGVAVEMGYSVEGSGAGSEEVVPALINYFGYSSAVNIKERDDYTETQWISMLKNNLNAGMPLYYSGYTEEAGHAFVFDGYQEDANGSHFHVNWGWSGYGNGYFYVNNLASPGGNFDYWQQAIFNIVPAQGYPANCTGLKVIDGTAGTFDDGSGFGEYQNNLSCSWLINPAVNVLNIKLSFDRFATEAGSDVVTVYDGDNTSAPVLGTFSGSTLPSQLTSTGKKMLVVFQTNGNTKAQGWSASYTTTKPVYCNNLTVVTDPAGTISDGSGTYNYNATTNCRWRMEPPNVSAITLQFTEFDITPSDDSFEVYDVSSSPYTLLDTYSGSQVPASKTYNTSKLLLWFKSQNNPKTGWSLNYTTTPLSVGEIKESEVLNIFPVPALDELQITWHTQITDCRIRVYNANGTRVIEKSLSGSSHTLDISSLRSGIYRLHFLSDKHSFSRTFLKL